MAANASKWMRRLVDLEKGLYFGTPIKVNVPSRFKPVYKLVEARNSRERRQHVRVRLFHREQDPAILATQ
jgi:hypothetical protein